MSGDPLVLAIVDADDFPLMVQLAKGFVNPASAHERLSPAVSKLHEQRRDPGVKFVMPKLKPLLNAEQASKLARSAKKPIIPWQSKLSRSVFQACTKFLKSRGLE